MRRRDWVEIQAGGTWPENPGAVGSGSAAKDPYSWIRLDNRGLADVVWNIDGPIFTALSVADVRKYYDKLRAGERRVRNIGRPAATELHFLNLDSVNTAQVLVEYDTEPIVDLQGFIPQTQLPFLGTTPVDTSTTAFAVKDISLFFAESSTPLAANGVFTGPWRDSLLYNWIGAWSLADVAGTLNIDESPDSGGVGAVQVTTQAAAAIGAGLPNTGKFLARATAQKVLMRYWRVRYVNGATIQASFNLQSTESPLN